MNPDEYTWVLVSRNPGKAGEYEQLLKTENIHVITLRDIGFQGEIIENGATFEENALLKLEAVSASAGGSVIADDSGLEVDALQGRPGVHSARYAGENANDASNRRKLLEALQDEKVRTARFVCVLGYQSKELGPLLFRASCEGTIAEKEAGANGFGYDPVFIPLGYDRTFGELDGEMKRKLSHRAKAVGMMLERLRLH